MAEVSSEGGGGKPKSGKPKQKKSSTKIDMTPMVDLAFLLLTFFMLTTSFSKPKTMPVIMPEKPKEKPKEINQFDVMHLILAPDDKLFYYIGIDNPEVRVAHYDPTSKRSIRKVLVTEQNKNFRERAGGDSSQFRFTVLIKPMEGSRYKNLVDMFDEMNISHIRSYALVDIAPSEIDLVKKYEAKAGEAGQ
jgi:biopolymer transport protein ExbD